MRRATLVLVLSAGCTFLPAAAGADVAVGLSSGHHHSCAISSEGALDCWGYNWSGQLGDGTLTYRAAPTPVPGLAEVVSVAAGNLHTCAVTSGGAVKCWGWNGYGQLGDGTTVTRTTPVDVLGLAGVTAVAARGHHTCAATAAGGLWCWGWNAYGQLGDGTTTDRHAPVPVTGLAGGVRAVAGGFLHTCAVTSTGGISCWGSNDGGQLGDGSATRRTTPIGVQGLPGVAASVTTGDYHTCAVSSSGAAYCWGWNAYGQLGDGTTTMRLAPVQVAGLGAGASGAAAGGAHTCAVTGPGTVRCWGYNEWGQLGDGTTANRAFPGPVAGLETGFVAVSGGTAHACALTVGGAVKCWGWTGWGELGDGYVPHHPIPTDVVGLTSGVLRIVSGAHHACVILSNGGVRCWGYNSNGELGDGTTATRPTAAYVSGLTSGVTAVAGGDYHTCAVTIAGAVRCWGGNSLGQLGDGTFINRSTPTAVANLAGAASVVAGAAHTCALASQGGVRCWGDNAHGQLGNGTTTGRATPADVAGLPAGALLLAAGGSHTCAVTPSRALRCWGANAAGQLGDGSIADRWEPVQVSNLTNGVLGVAAGDAHTCALVGGAVMCWGRNDWGQLGDGTFTNRSAPVQVSGLTGGVVAVEAGGSHSCAVLTGGAVQCWGRNDWGQLGDGTMATRPAPVVVSAPTAGAAGVAAGAFHTCALTGASGAKCWGADFYGQVGDGTTFVRTIPVAVQRLDNPSVTSITPAAVIAGSPAVVLTVYGLDFASGATVLVEGSARPTTRISAVELRAALAPGDVIRPGGLRVHVQGSSPGSASNVVALVVRPAGSSAASDFDGDGQADLLWEHADGWVAAWLMSGVTQARAVLLSDTPAAVGGWRIAATGDFNGDGLADILWESESGYVAAWMMSGARQVASQLLHESPVAVGGWRVAAAADLDRDGIADILWQHPTGYVACWRMGVDWKGWVYQQANALLDPRPVAAGGWSIAAAGDLNGDGMADLVWQHVAGHAAAWLMNGLEQAASGLLDPAPAATGGWTIAGTADLNGDRFDDLLWQKRPVGDADGSAGWLATWFMRGTSHAATASLVPPRVADPAWRVAGPK